MNFPSKLFIATLFTEKKTFIQKLKKILFDIDFYPVLWIPRGFKKKLRMDTVCGWAFVAGSLETNGYRILCAWLLQISGWIKA